MSDDASDDVFVAGVEAALLPEVVEVFPPRPPLPLLPLDAMFPFACNNRLANMLYLNEQEEPMAQKQKKTLNTKTYTITYRIYSPLALLTHTNRKCNWRLLLVLKL